MSRAGAAAALGISAAIVVFAVLFVRANANNPAAPDRLALTCAVVAGIVAVVGVGIVAAIKAKTRAGRAVALVVAALPLLLPPLFLVTNWLLGLLLTLLASLTGSGS